MHPVNAKKLGYLRAEAAILRSTGLSVKEIYKKLKKIWTLGSEMVVKKWWVWRQEDWKSLMRQLKEFWTKLSTEGETRQILNFRQPNFGEFQMITTTLKINPQV